jgi:primosomal protein N' (replication factor Y)
MSVSPEFRFADVILPVPLERLYTYRIHDNLTGSVIPGKRVVVQFGKTKLYTAVVYAVHNNDPVHYEPKLILELLDRDPVVTPNQFRLWDWIADYYLCPLGDIYAAAMPSALKLQSETVVAVSPDFDSSSVVLTPEEESVLNALRSGEKSLTIAAASKASGSSHGMKLVRQLLERRILVTQEELQEQYQPRKVSSVRFTSLEQDEAYMKQLFAQLEKRAPKQLDTLMGLFRMRQDTGRDHFPKQVFLKQTGTSDGALRQLAAKGVVELFDAEVDLIPASGHGSEMKVELSIEQEQAFSSIREHFETGKVVLLHGVTASGKTEVYIRLINDMIAKGRQVLYLLPEIALTTQIIQRLRRHFGDRMLVFHSRFSAGERAEVYMKMTGDGINGQFRYPIVVGARSAVFLPLKNPGLVIVDEEHDGSYKQQDPSPRYHARDTAIMTGALFGCNVLLGSATPSMETYYNTTTGKYALVKIHQRFGGARLPSVRMIDLKEAYRKGRMKSYFSQELLDGMRATLAEKEQIILFQNRRGFAPVLECRKCGWMPQCVNCDVSLTYHKKSNQLRCHYCGYATLPPVKCLACSDPDVRMKGIGTERVEDEISIFFPESNIERLDLDTTSSKSAFQRIISGFEHGEIDILVGTQMVTKGLDFDRVGLVGVLNADALIRFPDFRAAERSFQLLAQVAGRSGRRFRQGKVLIQTFQPQHPVLQFIANHDFEAFYRYESEERSRYFFPPFCRLIELRLKHRDERKVIALAKELTRELRTVFGKRVIGPVTPPVARIRNLYLQHVLIKVEKGISNQQVKDSVARVRDRFLSQPDHRSLIIQVDVDPD